MRQAKCKRCGIVFAAVGEQTYCDTCRAQVKRDTVIRQRTCRQCGAAFDGGPRASYCPDCRIERRRQRDVHQKQNGPSRKIGSTDICVVCGKEYTVTSGRQKYCPECKDNAVRIIVNDHKREYMSAHSDVNVTQKKARKTDRRVCPICGNTFTADTATTTCSDVCADALKKQWQKNADTKRAPRKRR